MRCAQSRIAHALKHQFRVCFTGKWFAAALAIGVAIAVAAALDAYRFVCSYQENYVTWWGWGADQIVYDGYSNVGSYASWIIPNSNASVFATIFYYIIPLLALFPFAWSLQGDRASGYDLNLLPRMGSSRYFASKIVATFASSLVVTCAPLIVNFLVLSCLLPAYPPRYEDCHFLGIFEDALFAWLFYNHPLGYVGAFTLFSGILMGIWSIFVLMLGRFFSTRLGLMAVPYLLVLGASYVSTTMFDVWLPSLSFIEQIRGISFSTVTDIKVTAAECVALLAASAALLYGVRRRDLC